jgi:hypothetical protein
MDSTAWFLRRERWLEGYRAAHGGQAPVCVVCGRAWTLRGGDLHHRSYARLGAESAADLVPICREDHDALHTVMDRNPAWRKVPREQATEMIVSYLRARANRNGAG